MQIYEILSKKYSMVTNEKRTVLYEKTDKNGVSELVKDLSAHSVNIFEVSLSNVKKIVYEQLNIGGQ